MRKVISLIMALMLCFSVCGMAHAAEDDFVPSISYKPGPSLETGRDDGGRATVGTIYDASGNILGYVYDEDCLAVTTIAEALDDANTGIPADAEALLEQVYQEILKNKGGSPR